MILTTADAPPGAWYAAKIAPMPGGSVHIPSALRPNARWLRLGTPRVPALVVHPGWRQDQPSPVVLWMHGRTVSKELDPGRYLRWMRAGIGACAVDLPGHGERYRAELQEPQGTLEVLLQMLDEIDPVVEALGGLGVFDLKRLGIGGVSGGGMAALVRLCRDHPFRCASVEATSGSWRREREGPAFRGRWEAAAGLEPIAHLDGWREIPVQAIHARLDEWVAIEGQAEFIEALRRRYAEPGLVELVEYDRTGAPYEHAGFGRMAADAKSRQLAFFRRWLGDAGP
jgi:alpha-beta hydrolase superfamily lysophospholipase